MAGKLLPGFFVLMCVFIIPKKCWADDPVPTLPPSLSDVAAETGKQSWIIPPDGKMWAEIKHDFGVAPRGSKLHYRFIFRNTSSKPIHLAELKRSCGCTEATSSPSLVQPNELGNIDVVMDTRPFSGSKTVTLQLLFSGSDKPITQTLTIIGFSRGDIVYNPSGSIQFGMIDMGTNLSRNIEIEYAGNLEWKMENIAELPEGLDVKFEEAYRRPGGVGYRVSVGLKAGLQPGEFKKTVQFKTNDPTNPVLPVLVEGSIRPAVTIVPTPLFFGSGKTGQLLTRRVTIRAKEPFTILASANQNPDITVTTPQGKNVVHSIVVQWRPRAAGETNDSLRIQTDIPANQLLTVPVQGTAY